MRTNRESAKRWAASTGVHPTCTYGVRPKIREALRFGFFLHIAVTCPYLALPQAHGCSGATTEPTLPVILFMEYFLVTASLVKIEL
jgi:hypothetical protein